MPLGISPEDHDKLVALMAVARPRVGEVLAIYWPSPDDTVFYAGTQLDELPGYEHLTDWASPVQARLLLDHSSPMLELSRTSSISDDTVDVSFNDLDDELSRLTYTHGEGVRTEVFAYYPDVDLFLSLWRGATRAPKDSTIDVLKMQLSTGFRSPQMVLPRRLLSTPSCVALFGGKILDAGQLAANDCRYDRHLGGSFGNLDGGVPFANCKRDSTATCNTVLGDGARSFLSAGVVIESVANNQTKGPNLLATTVGNSNNLSSPLRVIFGERDCKQMDLLAFAPEPDTKHPDKGWVKALFAGAEGPVASLSGFRINNVLVGYEHLNLRTGEIRQPPTAFSPNIGNFSGTVVAFGRIQGNFNNVTADQLQGFIHMQGLNNIRVFSDDVTYTEQYSTNRMWCLLRMLTDQRWGYGADINRYDINSCIEVADWCDEFINFVDANGNLFSGVRSTFNAELTSRSTQQQINDVCIAGRISPPFEFNGKEVFTPLRKETLDDTVIPFFTDYGDDKNIIVTEGRPQLTRSQLSDTELINQVTVSFDDAANGYTSVSLVFGDQDQQLKAGKAWGDTSIRIINKNYPAFGITNQAEASRLANLLLYLGPNDAGGLKNNLEIKFTTWWSKAANVIPYKLIKVASHKLERYGFDYFRVKSIKRKSDLKVEIVAQAYPVTFYEQMESLVLFPPIIVGGIVGSPGPHAIPCDTAFSILQHIHDRIEFTLDLC